MRIQKLNNEINKTKEINKYMFINIKNNNKNGWHRSETGEREKIIRIN